MNFKLIVSTISLLLLFIGCGGGSSDNTNNMEQNSSIENIAPNIEHYESNATVKISMYDDFKTENNISVISILASDKNEDNLTYSLSGVDSDKFIISKGELFLKKYENYGLPLDYNFDNIYEVTVTVSDGKGGVDIVNFNIEIKHKYEIVAPIVVEVTPTPTPKPTIEVTPTPTTEPTIEITPTPIPTVEVTPTPIITLAPTAIPDSVISMNINEEYTVNKGDKVEILAEDSVINVLHTLDDNTKVITLISGSANLIKGDFVVVE